MRSQMFRCVRCGIAAGLMVLCAAATFAQNKTVGNEVGADHGAFVYAPYRWQADRAEDKYRDHVTSAPGSGQQYTYYDYLQTARPSAATPSPCNISRLYTIIHDETSFLGTFLYTTHGKTNGLSAEVYEHSAAGKTARDDRYTAYRNGTVAGVPALGADEIYKSEKNDPNNADYRYYTIGVTDKFISTRGRLTQGLVYVGACKGGSMTDDFVAADARVSVGNAASRTPAEQRERITKFFKRMDGKEGQLKRPVSAARAGLDLTAAGEEATTLAPSVLSVSAPCPIKAGDIVTYTLDTECEMGIPADIVGYGCTIEMETWVNKTTLRGTCTAPPPPGAWVFVLRLKWDNCYSDKNVARLDGNVRPPRNAEGPAHDDYISLHICFPFFCPPTTTPEDEDCPVRENDGCNTVPPTYSDLDTVNGNCATTWADGNSRDTDYWRVHILEPSVLTVAIQTRAVPLVSFVTPETCPFGGTASSPHYVQPNNSMGYSCNLMPGVYNVFVAPGTSSGAIFNGFPCSTINNQQYSLAAAIAPLAPPDPPACAGATPEPEPCGLDTNGGCNSEPAMFSPIEPGQPICGTLWAEGNTRDTDWFEFFVPSSTRVTLTGECSAAPMQIFLADTACPTAVLTFASSSPGLPASASALVGPGVYRAIVALGDGSGGIFGGYPCPVAQYRLEMHQSDTAGGVTCEEATPLPTPVHVSGSTAGQPLLSLPGECPGAIEPQTVGLWYMVIGDGTMMTASLCGGTNYDAALAVFTGSCSLPECVTGADDSACGSAPEATWCSVAGQQYHLLVHGANLSTGEFTLRVSSDGVTCTNSEPVGACCLGGDACVTVRESECTLLGGEFLGSDSECAEDENGELTCGSVGAPPCPGDVNGDRVVNLTDLAILLAHFGQPSGATRAEGDLSGDGAVSLNDLAMLLARYGSSCL